MEVEFDAATVSPVAWRAGRTLVPAEIVSSGSLRINFSMSWPITVLPVVVVESSVLGARTPKLKCQLRRVYFWTAGD